VIIRQGPVLTVEGPDGRRFDCVAKGRGKRAVVGDQVYVQQNADTELADHLVIGYAPRETELARADAFGRRAKVIAANVEQLWVVVAVEPPLRPGLIDRLIVAAEAQGIRAGILFNKIDLLPPALRAEIKPLLDVYRSIGYPVLDVSAHSGEGLEALQTALDGQISVFVGHSGVGKTSLLNALCPGLVERVQALSEASGRGIHTTTAAALFSIPSGGEIIDSPGVRTFALWDIDPEALRDYFVEFVPFAEHCRFSNCRHVSEPNCAVKAAVESGQITEMRYDSYLRMRATLAGEELRGT
jgi:ribosome biogenesis GTPase